MKKFKGFLRLASVALALAGGVAAAMTPQERSALDLSGYHVNNPTVALFDVPTRRAYLATTQDAMLRKRITALRAGPNCAAAMAMPVISGALFTPKFYEDRAAWQQAATIYHGFEDTVDQLAAGALVANDDRHGICVLTMLQHWAEQRAFLDFTPETSGIQTWFQIESSLTAAALSYMQVRDSIAGMDTEKKTIENWLFAVAKMHLARQGGADGSCCNNHFYRRALYAEIIGVLTRDDALFRIGVSAVYSALSDSNADGALRLEMARGANAAKYQVYATMYLVTIAQIAKLQGYDLYQLSDGDRSLDTIIGYSLAVLRSPDHAAADAGTADQNTEFAQEDQYLVWLEMLADHPAYKDSVAEFLKDKRPSYNRSLGGDITLYFYKN